MSQFEDLQKQIAYHDKLYYQQDAPEISDPEYDSLVVKLRTLADQMGLSSFSPSKPGNDLTNHLAKVNHYLPMLSIRTEVDVTEVTPRKFLERVDKLAGRQTYVAEYKYDGLAASLIYKNGRLQHIVTRGDGWVGDDITATVSMIKNIPKTLEASKHLGDDIIEVRGEVVLSLACLKIINDRRRKYGMQPYVNARNAAAGMVRRADTSIDELKYLSFMPYSVTGIPEIKTQTGALEWLNIFFRSEDFMADRYAKANGVAGLMEFYNNTRKIRGDLPFEIDGVVYKVDDLSVQKEMGVSGREPLWAVAHKLTSETAVTTLERIDVQIGPTGRATPVARIKPVFVGGTTVSNVTLSNVFQIRRKGVRIGDRIIIRRAGDVIPEIVGQAFDNVRSEYVNNYIMPVECPVCGATLVRDKGMANTYCPAITSCSAQLAGTITMMVSRSRLNIDGFGPMLASSIVRNKSIDSPYDAFSLSDKCYSEAGLGPMQISNLHEAIEKTFNSPMTFERFIYSLCIPSIGEAASKRIVSLYGNFMKAQIVPILTAPIEGLTVVNVRNFNRFFLNEFDKVLSFYNKFNIIESFKKTESDLTGKSIVVTGGYPGASRDYIKDIIESYEGNFSKSVSKNTDLVVYGDGAGDKLEKAKSLGIPLMEISEFLKTYEG